MSIGKWIDVSSEDEDQHKKRSHKSKSSKSSSPSSNKCLMAKGNESSSESNVSDDDSPLHKEINELAQKQLVAIDKLFVKHKRLKDKLVSSSTNYQELKNKYECVLIDNDELTRRIKSFELKATKEASTSSFDIKIKKDASISCIDLIFESHSPPCMSWYESVTIDELALENEKLKQEVQQLKMDLASMKEQAQPSQDNCSKVVNKLEEGQTVVCFICHKEGHKSYMCKNKKIEEEKKKRERPRTKGESPPMPTQSIGLPW